MPYAERHSNVLDAANSLAIVEMLLANRWMNDYGVRNLWRLQPSLILDDGTPVGITASCDWDEIRRVHLDPRYSWLIVMETLASTEYSHFLMDVTVSPMVKDVEAPKITPRVLTEKELEELDDQIRVKDAIEEALCEFSAGGWFSVAIKQTPKPTLVIFYDEWHAKSQGYTQKSMRAFVRNLLGEIDIVHGFSSMTFLHSYLSQIENDNFVFIENTDFVFVNEELIYLSLKENSIPSSIQARKGER